MEVFYRRPDSTYVVPPEPVTKNSDDDEEQEEEVDKENVEMDQRSRDATPTGAADN